jgi:hypothetical protein
MQWIRRRPTLVHDLIEPCVGLRNLADPMRIDSTRPDDSAAQHPARSPG